MIFLWIFLVLLLLVLFVLLVNVHLIFTYYEKESIKLRVLCFTFDAKKLYARYQTRAKGKNLGTQSKVDLPSKNKSVDLIGFTEFLMHITRVLSLAAKESLEKMKIYLKELVVTVGTDDAAKTALSAAAAIQAANGLCALLQHFSNFRWNNRNLSVSPDFTSEKSRFSIHLDVSMKPIHIIGVLLRAYTRFFERKEMKK